MSNSDSESRREETNPEVLRSGAESSIGAKKTVLGELPVAPGMENTLAASGGVFASDDTVAAVPAIDLGGADTALGASGNAGDHVELVTVSRKHYSLGREIARGGMGRIVYARDRRLGRPIAVKELLSPTPALERRFEREMRITARLQHPAIISVHEAGRWPDGVAFYTMKLVQGRPLEKAIAAVSTTRERLALLPHLIAVADALAYSHDQGVIHRDLKPANVLVGDYGETVVIDWGLAKELARREDADEFFGELRNGGGDEVGLTIVGQAMGTPAYMPPEQARGEVVDERADVYALGAMLYHMLSGQMPFTGAKSAREVLDKLRLGPPPRLQDITLDVPSDLSAIVDKAMAREAAERYPSAKELTEDLRRFETGKRVSVHEYSAPVLLKRWVARHRAVVSAAAVLVCVLTVGSVWSFSRIAMARDSAEQERDKVVRARDMTAQARDAAEEARDAAAEAKSAAEDERNRARDDRNEAERLIYFIHVELRNLLEAKDDVGLLRLLSRKTLAYYERRPIDWKRPDKVSSRASALDDVGDDLLREQKSKLALAKFTEALELRQRLAVEASPIEIRQAHVAVSHYKVAGAHFLLGRFDKSLEHYSASLKIRQALVEEEPPDSPGSVHYDASVRRSLSHRHGVASALSGIAHVLREKGQYERALATSHSAFSAYQQLASEKAHAPEGQRWLSFALQNLGDIYLAKKDYRTALGKYQSSLKIREQLVDGDTANPTYQQDLAASRAKIGSAYRALSKHKDALSSYRSSLAITEELVERKPDSIAAVRTLYLRYSEVAALLMESGEQEAGVEYYRKCESRAIEAGAMVDLYNAACCAALSGDPDGAFESLERSLDMGWSKSAKLVSDTDLSSLRTDSRWRPLMERAGVQH